jgi:hypothetical protein
MTTTPLRRGDQTPQPVAEDAFVLPGHLTGGKATRGPRFADMVWEVRPFLRRTARQFRLDFSTLPDEIAVRTAKEYLYSRLRRAILGRGHSGGRAAPLKLSGMIASRSEPCARPCAPRALRGCATSPTRTSSRPAPPGSRVRPPRREPDRGFPRPSPRRCWPGRSSTSRPPAEISSPRCGMSTPCRPPATSWISSRARPSGACRRLSPVVGTRDGASPPCPPPSLPTGPAPPWSTASSSTPTTIPSGC